MFQIVTHMFKANNKRFQHPPCRPDASQGFSSLYLFRCAAWERGITRRL